MIFFKAMVASQIVASKDIPAEKIVAVVLFGNPYFKGGAPQNKCGAVSLVLTWYLARFETMYSKWLMDFACSYLWNEDRWKRYRFYGECPGRLRPLEDLRLLRQRGYDLPNDGFNHATFNLRHQVGRRSGVYR